MSLSPISCLTFILFLSALQVIFHVKTSFDIISASNHDLPEDTCCNCIRAISTYYFKLLDSLNHLQHRILFNFVDGSFFTYPHNIMFQIQVRSVHIILQFNIELFYHACPLFLAHSHLVGNAYIFKVHFLIKACSIEAICCYFGVRYVDFIFVFTFCFLTLLFLLFFILFWVLQSQNLDKLRFRFVDYID